MCDLCDKLRAITMFLDKMDLNKELVCPLVVSIGNNSSKPTSTIFKCN